MATRPTGQLVFLSAPETLEIREYEVPEPGPGSIMTEIVRANVCGSELHIWRGHHPAVREAVLGHEALCRVRELGADVDTDAAGQPIEPGDLVAPVYFITCQECYACQHGEFNRCQNGLRHWAKSPDEPPHFHGTFASHYFIHPDQYFYRVPDGLDERIAAGANCALSQVMFGLDEVGLEYGDTLVVQGAGGLGLNAVAYANERGAETIVIEGVDGRIDRARAFGADHVVDFREHDTVEARADRVRGLTDGVGADVGIEVAGTPDAFSEGVELLRDGGRYLEIGNISPGHTTDFDPGTLTRKSVSITAVLRYDPWYLKRALDFLDENADSYPYADLVDAEFDLVDVDEALARSDGREVTRAALVPGHDH